MLTILMHNLKKYLMLLMILNNTQVIALLYSLLLKTHNSTLEDMLTTQFIGKICLQLIKTEENFQVKILTLVNLLSTNLVHLKNLLKVYLKKQLESKEVDGDGWLMIMLLKPLEFYNFQTKKLLFLII
jgi:hypothetical protein